MKTRIVLLVLEDATPQLWGGEAALRNGVEIGEVRPAAYGHTLGAAVALCQLEADTPVTADFLNAGSFEIDLAGVRCPATTHLRSPYDPKGARARIDE